MRWTKEEMNSAKAKVEALAAKDSEFRKLCLSDAHAAVKKATGKDVEPSYKLKFVENQGGYETFVLPNFQGSGDQLSNADLDTVAGGSK
ncbi:MAG: hypothetical protein APF77_17210 [Clostridia bacterium BRH_c25]|nr:MAG: hypothetical protein APF77_17210 [Clostridia bacterium BRH_c25]